MKLTSIRSADSEAINDLETKAVQKGRFDFLSEWLSVAILHRKSFDAKALQYKAHCILVAEDKSTVHRPFTHSFIQKSNLGTLHVPLTTN